MNVLCTSVAEAPEGSARCAPRRAFTHFCLQTSSEVEQVRAPADKTRRAHRRRRYSDTRNPARLASRLAVLLRGMRTLDDPVGPVPLLPTHQVSDFSRNFRQMQ